MQTQCNESRIEFHGLGERVLTADFEGGNIVSDGGVPLIAEVDRMFHVLRRYAECFTDHRDQELIFMIGESAVLGKFHRVQPEFGDVPITFRMDVNGLTVIRAEEQETVRADLRTVGIQYRPPDCTNHLTNPPALRCPKRIPIYPSVVGRINCALN